jgi:hypothetical protein
MFIPAVIHNSKAIETVQMPYNKYIMEFYSGIKKNEILSFAGK